jgi:hypothetical protein
MIEETGRKSDVCIQALVTPEVNELFDEKVKAMGLSRSAAGREAIKQWVGVFSDET